MILFLSEIVVRSLHETLIDLYGGVQGIRDTNVLDAALNMPKAQFEGKFLHHSIFHMAAAYGFHISEGQPFFDGNKRTGGMAMLTFLEINGYASIASSDEYYNTMLAVANKRMNKEQLTKWLEKVTVKK